MRTAVFSTKSYDRQFLAPAAQAAGHMLTFLEPRLSPQTAVLAREFPAICSFVNDYVTAEVLEILAAGGTKFVALRCAGFNQIDLEAAGRVGIRVARVPAYSPHAVAEHAIGMMLALNRKFHKAFNRVREGNFALEGLLGFDMHGKTAGVVGTGKIGAIVAQLLACFGCDVLLYDVVQNAECAAVGRYVTLPELWARCDIVTLHCPLTPATEHLIDARSIAAMKPGVMFINTSRGALVDTQAVIDGLKSGRIGYLGLDVYEEEADLFFENLSERVIQDDVFTRLLTFPNVLITAHQAFFTQTALAQIATVTMQNLTAFEQGNELANEVRAVGGKK
ncbi:MAG: 2-hydroxyacid dehydrogenase [Planctomycetaceae bacterium]|nr:2-hydroxyacid dehydrogenase [Planctomycetaceae bacterium]